MSFRLPVAALCGLLVLLPAAGAASPVAQEHPDIVLRRAFLAEASGNYAEAIRHFELYLERGKESAHVRSQFARVLSIEGKNNRAEVQALRALELAPRSTAALVIYAEVMRRSGRLDDARTRLADAIGRLEASPEIEFQLAEIYYAQKKFKEAQVHFRQVLFHADAAGAEATGYRQRALWRLANLHLRLGDQEGSRFYFVRFVRRNPGNVFARFVLGYYLYFRQGDYDRARRELEAVAAHSPARLRRSRVKPAQLYSALGRIYLVQNDHRAAVTVRRAVRSGSRDVLDRVLLAAVQGRNRTALRYLNAYLKRNSESFPARIARLRILEEMDVPDLLTLEYLRASILASRMRQYSVGIDLARAGLRANELRKEDHDGPSSQLKQQIAAHYESLDQPYRAVFYLNEALEEGERAGRWKGDGSQKRLQLELALGRLLSRVGRNEDALRLCNRLVDANPGYARAYYVRGNVLRRMSRPKEAEADFSRATELAPKNFLYPFFRATLRNERGDFAGTEADLRRVLELKPDFAEASNFLGYLYAERGIKLQESLRLIERAIEAAPVNGAFQDSLGWVYFRLGRYERARYHLQLAVLLLEEEENEDAVVYEHLGDVHLKLGHAGRALTAYRRGMLVLTRTVAKRALNREETELRARLSKKISELHERGTELRERPRADARQRLYALR